MQKTHSQHIITDESFIKIMASDMNVNLFKRDLPTENCSINIQLF